MIKKIALSIGLLLLLPPLTNAGTFPDVSEDHNYYVAIESLYNLEIIHGHIDGLFKPEDTLNRAESLKMILTSAEIIAEGLTGSSGFTDVPQDSWFNKYVLKGKTTGIVDGNADGKFAPARLVNKAELLKMLLEAFETDLSKHFNKSGISADISSNDWFSPYFSYAKTVSIISPTLENLLKPGKLLTRGETAEIIYKLLVIEKGGDTQKLLNIAESSLVNVLIEINNNDIQAAIDNANQAIFYTEQSLANNPETGIVKAANKISLGFRELCYAYQAGLDNDYDSLVNHVSQASAYAGSAYEDDSSTQYLGQQIKAQGNLLLSQI